MPKGVGYKGGSKKKAGNPSKAKKKATKPSTKADVTPTKAKKILKDGAAQGKPLTRKQEKMFGAIAGKSKKK